ncbi:MAG: hypothetical protein K0R18_293 [Bacillales bacterium]|jgi:SNF2 family DNA or RNA helicase|nr:hypothetical protein [Bacillales bacterium]
MEATALYPHNVLASDKFEFKTKPYQHQIDSFNYAEENEMFALCDEQGLGKTKQVIDIAMHKKVKFGYKHTLIVCGIKNAQGVWFEEVPKHSEEEAWILGTRVSPRGKIYWGGNVNERIQDLEAVERGEIDQYFLVTNAETLKNPRFQEKVKELTESGVIGMCVVDEIHKKLGNAEGKIAKGLAFLQSYTRVAVTGTLLMNRPTDLYNTLSWLGVEKATYNYFKNRYVKFGGKGGFGIVGYKNLRELRIKLNKVMLRRKKHECVDLPQKIYKPEYIQMTENQQKIYADIRNYILANIQKIKLSPNPLAQLIRLRQATAHTGILSDTIQESAKFDRMLEIVEENVARDGKVIIFSNWAEVTSRVYEVLKEKYNPAMIVGGTKEPKAEEKKFMNDESCKVIIGTYGAMGASLTLTRATEVLMLDKPWNPGNTEQAEDRGHRIGLQWELTVRTLICEGTIDERIEDIIAEKQDLCNAIIEGDEDTIDRLSFDTEDTLERLLGI